MFQIADFWFRIGVYIGLAVCLLSAVWVLADSIANKRNSTTTKLWGGLVILGLILQLPGLFYRFFQIEELVIVGFSSFVGQIAAAVNGQAASDPQIPAGITISVLLGIVGLILSLTAAIVYTIQRNQNPFSYVEHRDPLPNRTHTLQDIVITDSQSTFEDGRSRERSIPIPKQDPTKIINPPEPTRGWLIIRNGPSIDTDFPLKKADAKIGRSSNCQIVLDSDTVSREHAKIVYCGNGMFEILDLGSRNGTKVNNMLIQKRQMLYDNDVIQVGEIKLIFKSVK